MRRIRKQTVTKKVGWRSDNVDSALDELRTRMMEAGVAESDVISISHEYCQVDVEMNDYYVFHVTATYWESEETNHDSD